MPSLNLVYSVLNDVDSIYSVLKIACSLLKRAIKNGPKSNLACFWGVKI